MNMGKNSVLNICLGRARVLPWHGWREKAEGSYNREQSINWVKREMGLGSEAGRSLVGRGRQGGK